MEIYKLTMNQCEYYNEVRKNYIEDIKSILKKSKQDKAILSFKYDHLNFRINLIQITIIFISASLTLMESIKTYYNEQNEAIDIVAILFTCFIGIIMTLYRFLKLENKKERVGNIFENFNFIINKLLKLKNEMETLVITNDNTDQWAIISYNYENEILTNYISLKESFDNNLSYKETLYYKDKYKKFLLEEEFINNELKTIYNFKDKPHTVFKKKQTCLFLKSKFDYNSFIKSFEEENSELINQKKSSKMSNQDLYFKYNSNKPPSSKKDVKITVI